MWNWMIVGCFYKVNLSVTDDGYRPRHVGWCLQQKPWVDGESKDIVEVVDDAADQGQAWQSDQDRPENPPTRTASQLNVVKSVRGGP